MVRRSTVVKSGEGKARSAIDEHHDAVGEILESGVRDGYLCNIRVNIEPSSFFMTPEILVT